MNTAFVFEDARGKHKITMRKASAEWANSDCPDIYIVHPGAENSGWRVNSGGTFIESNQEWIQRLFIEFFLSSSKAFYRKYPHCKSSSRNGFWANFLYDNAREYNNMIR